MECKYPVDYAFNYSQVKVFKREREVHKLKINLENKINSPLIITNIETSEKREKN